MESAEEPSLDQIKPPRLEDAGLEDCALPPEAIQEAFLKAAMSARSIISDSDEDDDDDEDCLIDPFPTTNDSSNEYGVVGLDVLEEGEACVDGMHGLKITDKDVDIMGKNLKGKNDDLDEEKEEEHEKGKIVV